MKTFFTGYFAPSETEFKELWKNCVFAFDANVLLGLYRSTTETQQVFFSVLEKIADRIFLPHQAASEYLRNRLGVISIRSDSFGRINAESDKLAKLIESVVQEHALRNGKEFVKIARDAADKISDLVRNAVKEEPDLLRADGLLAKLAELFRENTGEPYTQQRLSEIYNDAAQRYAKSVPPGFKDDKKQEPDKYGDVLIWFQLLDHAKQNQKPMIFVTGDAKEDWWQQHRGDTLGPRPELRQEMMAVAKAPFYMYTAQRFLEFAKQFLNLTFDTKKAESEFEKIEKQDKEAAESVDYETVALSGYVNNSLPYTVNSTYLGGSPTSIPWWGVPAEVSSVRWMEPEDPKLKNKYFSLLPVNGHVYESSTGTWKCEIASAPNSTAEEHVCYQLQFEPNDRAKGLRYLKLWVSVSALEHDSDWRYKNAISRVILKFLSVNQTSAEIRFYP
jgi:PIN domain-containing protein